MTLKGRLVQEYIAGAVPGELSKDSNGCMHRCCFTENRIPRMLALQGQAASALYIADTSEAIVHQDPTALMSRCV